MFTPAIQGLVHVPDYVALWQETPASASTAARVQIAPADCAQGPQ